MLEERRNPDVSVIIPVYNEDKTIGEVLRRLMKIRWPLQSMEIVVVDDGSTDNTSKEVAGFPSVKYIRHDKNRGKGAAVRTGLRNSTGKAIVIQDADMEYAPEYIPRLVEPILANRADVVYGSRIKGKREGMTFSHYVGNRILSFAAQILHNVRITDVMTGYKAFNRAVFSSFDLKENGFAFEVEVTSKSLQNGWRFMELPADYSLRRNGKSKIVYLDGVKSLMKLVTDRCVGVGVSNCQSRGKNESGSGSKRSL